MKTEKLNLKIFFLILVAGLMGSCKSDHAINHASKFQKRKYTKGYHVNVRSPFENNAQPEILANTDQDVIPVIVSTIDANETMASPEKILGTAHKRAVGELNASIDPSAERTEWNQPFINHRPVFPDMETVSQKYTVQYLKEMMQPVEAAEGASLNVLSLLSFIFSLIGLGFAAIPFGVAAIICGAIALDQFSKSPGTYTGKGFAIVGLIIGIVDVIVGIYIVATLAAM